VARTDVGRRRDTNEDAFAIRPDLGLMVVADGMGGHAAGEVASTLAVQTITQLLSDPKQGWWPRAPLASHLAAEALAYVIARANEDVYAAALASPTLRGMGTTVVATLLFRGCVAVAHVGDSRAYLLRDGSLIGLTADHTVSNEWGDGKESADDHPSLRAYWHSLTRAVGTTPTVKVDTHIFTPCAGDVLLLCSDGLTNVVDEELIAEIIAASRSLDEAAAHLIAYANQNGGPDNVTVALQRWT
jgi:protein phosphatase